MPEDVFKIAKWFIKQGLDDPRNKFDGNMKLQKLLYFAQLIHLEQFNQPLFDETIRAFENGAVVESVRVKYRDDNSRFVEEANRMFEDFQERVIKTLQLTAELFGDYSAKELSELNHNHECWQKALNNSKDESGFYDKDKNIITIEKMRECAAKNIKEVIEAKKQIAKLNHEYEVINGVKFFYDPSEISLDEDIYRELQKYNKENSYTITKDPSQGLVIY